MQISFKRHCTAGGPGPNSENVLRKTDTVPQTRGHVRTPFETHEQWGLKETNLRAVRLKQRRKSRGGSRAEGGWSIHADGSANPLTMFVTPFSGFGRFPPGGDPF